MPIYNTICKKCFNNKRIVSDVEWDKVPIIKKMCKCGYVAIRQASGPGAQKMETLDNGAMPRAVTRLADAERIMQDRIAKADPLAGRKNFS